MCTVTRKHRHNCKIVLEVTTGSLCAMVPITFLSLCPSYWEITPPSDMENIQISGYFRPMLTFEWDNLAIKNKLSEKQIEVKTTIPLTYWQAYKLRKILNQPFCAYLVLIHDNYYCALSDWNHFIWFWSWLSAILFTETFTFVYGDFFPGFCAFFFYFSCQRACKGLMLETWT